MSLKSWFIKKLGGMAKEEKSDTLQKCRNFAEENLQPKKGVGVYSSEKLESYSTQEKLFILGSNVTLINVRAKDCVVAPWASRIHINGLITAPESAVITEEDIINLDI